MPPEVINKLTLKRASKNGASCESPLNNLLLQEKDRRFLTISYLNFLQEMKGLRKAMEQQEKEMKKMREQIRKMQMAQTEPKKESKVDTVGPTHVREFLSLFCSTYLIETDVNSHLACQ